MRKVPRLFLKYKRPIKLIGKGVFGEVTLHSKNGKMYAIKTIRSPKDDCVFPQDFLTELVCLSRSNHENVMKMVDFFCDFTQKKNDYFYIVMELGIDNLYDYEIDSDEEKKRFLLQILSGLQHLHNNGIVTGDLKFENIIVFENKVCISDFGLAQIIPQIRNKFWLLNKVYTLYYRPLECLLSNKCSPESDIWAFGVVLHKLMLGKMPFKTPIISENDSDFSDELEEKMKSEKILSYGKEKDFKYFSDFELWDDEFSNIKKNNKKFCSDEVLDDLLSKIFRLIPSERITLQECFNHEFFKEIKDVNIESPLNLDEVLEKYEITLVKRNIKLSEYILNFAKKKKLRKLMIKYELCPRIISIAIHLAHRFFEDEEVDLVFIICINLAILNSNYSTPYFDVSKELNNKYTNKKIMTKTLDMIKYLKCDMVNTTYADYIDLKTKDYHRSIIKKANEIAMSLYIYDYDFSLNSKKICEVSIELAQEFLNLPIENLSNINFRKKEKRRLLKLSVL